MSFKLCAYVHFRFMMFEAILAMLSIDILFVGPTSEYNLLAADCDDHMDEVAFFY